MQSDAKVRSKLAAAQGLYSLEQGRYKAAALKFAEVSAELGSDYSDVIALQVGWFFGGGGGRVA